MERKLAKKKSKRSAEPQIDGDLLRRYRRRTSRSPFDVAIELGVTERTVRYWENGDIPKKFKALPKLAELYGVEPVDFLQMESKAIFVNLCADFREMVEWSSLSVVDRNLETMRTSREILRWLTYFKTGDFDEVDEDEIIEERSKQREIDEALDSMLAGIDP